jgi:hypothetical protein
MSKPAAQHITPELAQEVCIRTGSKATVLGSISNLGGQYAVGLNAISCAGGERWPTNNGKRRASRTC